MYFIPIVLIQGIVLACNKSYYYFCAITEEYRKVHVY